MLQKYLRWLCMLLLAATVLAGSGCSSSSANDAPADLVIANANKMVLEGRQTFRFETFGDESFWGDTLKIHQAIAGAAYGGIGAGV